MLQRAVISGDPSICTSVVVVGGATSDDSAIGTSVSDPDKDCSRVLRDGKVRDVLLLLLLLLLSQNHGVVVAGINVNLEIRFDSVVVASSV